MTQPKTIRIPTIENIAYSFPSERYFLSAKDAVKAGSQLAIYRKSVHLLSASLKYISSGNKEGGIVFERIGEPRGLKNRPSAHKKPIERLVSSRNQQSRADAYCARISRLC